MTEADGKKSKELWEKCADNIKLPTVYRNIRCYTIN